jgi:hypothetical protein
MSTVMTGARAVIKVGDQVVGIFDSCQYGASIGTEPIHTLGRYSAVEISVTSYEAVQVSCSGFRIVKNNVHGLPKAPKLQNLISLETVNITVEDRKTGSPIATITNCVASNWSESLQAKGTTRFNITYIGTLLKAEDNKKEKAIEEQSEGQGATSF